MLDFIFKHTAFLKGKLIMFNAYRDCTEDLLSTNECIILANEFLSKMNIENMNYALFLW